MSSHPPYLVGLLCAGLFWTSGTRAQDRIPVPLPRQDSQNPEQVGPTRPELEAPSVHEPIGVHSDETFFTAPTDDEPDFAPREDVFDDDGNVVDSRPAGDPYVLSFSGGDYTPAPGLDPRLEQRLRSDPEGSSFAFVMVEGRMATRQKRDALTGLGCKILGIHTWQSFVVELPHVSMRRVEDLPFVRWVGFPQTAQKFEPRLAATILEAADHERLEVVLSVHASDLGPDSVTALQADLQDSDDPQEAVSATESTVPNGPFQKALEAAGFEFGHYFEIGNVFTFRGHATAAQVREIAALNFVAFAELYEAPGLADDHGMTMIGVDRVRGPYPGAGVGVGVVDSGVVGGSGRHVDLNKNFVGWSNVSGGAYVDPHSHGTHVTGTVGGTGTADQRYTGAAPDVGAATTNRVFIGRFFDGNGDPQGDFRTLFNAFRSDYTDRSGAVAQKPRVINNSWGTWTGSGTGAQRFIGTESAPRAVDGYVYNDRQLHVFAAGNRGVGALLEATSKNCLTVGSVQDNWSAGAVGAMSGFSQGGTRDSRRKPEVVAPGSSITSTSNLSTTGYRNKSGTSMATPHVTGMLAGLIDHYTSVFDLRPQNLKATAAATAQWLGNPGQSSGWFGDEEGMGLVNAYRMHWATSDYQSFWGTRTTPLASTGQWFQWELRMPADLEAARMVMTWIEPAASAGASIARVNDVRCYVDIEPFSSAGNVGDFTLSSSRDNLLSLASRSSNTRGFAALAAGKRVRFKVYGQSISSEALPALSVVAYRDDTYSSGMNHTLSVSETVVRPAQQITATARISSGTGLGEFENARIDPSFGTFTTLSMSRTTADGELHRYVSGTTWPSSPYPSLTGGMVLGGGTSRSVEFVLRAPTSDGTYSLATTASSNPAPSAPTRSVSVCVDGIPPRAPASLRSTSHQANVWSNDPLVRFRWLQAVDAGCAGVEGVGHAWRRGSPSTPAASTLSATTTSFNGNASDSANSSDGWYLRLRAFDHAANAGPTSTLGPYLIDTTDPTVDFVRIANGATSVSTLSVPVAAPATDTQSGPLSMRYSMNGLIWSAWRSYTSGSVLVNMAAHGGNTLEGTKRVHVQVRDRAGNVSPSESSTVRYTRLPVITNTVVGQVDTVGPSPLVFVGTDFVGTTSVQFGNRQITNTRETGFLEGWFDVVDDTRIEVHPPQGLGSGNYLLRLDNGTGNSNTVQTTLVYPQTPTLHTTSLLGVGGRQNWVLHHGGATGQIASYLVISPFNGPSVLPGVLSLDIGLNFASTFVVEPAGLHDPATGSARIGPLPIPAGLAGATWYAQAMQVDLGNLAVTPIPVTNATATSYL